MYGLSALSSHSFFFQFFMDLSIKLSFKLLALAAIIAEKGSDAWWYMKVEDLLPSKYRDKASEYVKGTDTMDVWFDSGIL